MPVDPGRAWIERRVDVPVVSYDWGQSEGGILVPHKSGAYGTIIEEWRKVSENIKRRRGKHPVGSEMWKACEEALGLVKFITNAGECGAIEGNWKPSHELLRQCAEVYERRNGHIDGLVQAMIRDAMDEAFVSERFTS